MVVVSAVVVLPDGLAVESVPAPRAAEVFHVAHLWEGFATTRGRAGGCVDEACGFVRGCRRINAPRNLAIRGKS